MSSWHIVMNDGGDFAVVKTKPDSYGRPNLDALANGTFPTKAAALEDFIEAREDEIAGMRKGLSKARRMLRRALQKDAPDV